MCWGVLGCGIHTNSLRDNKRAEVFGAPCSWLNELVVLNSLRSLGEPAFLQAANNPLEQRQEVMSEELLFILMLQSSPAELIKAHSEAQGKALLTKNNL